MCDSRASLVVGTCAEARAGRHAVRLDVEPQRVTTVGQRRARVHEQLGQVGDAGAPRALVYGDRRAERPPRESWHRVHALLARGRGGIPVPHGDGHGVHARAKADELLEDHALVGSQRLLEGADPYRFIARDLPGRSRVGAESDLHVVLGDEYVAVTLEAQGMVRERQGEHSQGGVGGRVGEVAHGGHEGEGCPGDEKPHAAVQRPRVGQGRQRGAGLRPRRRADALPGAAAGRRQSREQRHFPESSHLPNLKSGR